MRRSAQTKISSHAMVRLKILFIVIVVVVVVVVVVVGWVRWPGKVRRGNLSSFTSHKIKRRSKNISHPSVAGKGGAKPDFAVESFENRICSLVHVLQRCA